MYIHIIEKVTYVSKYKQAQVKMSAYKWNVMRVESENASYVINKIENGNMKWS